MGCLCQKIGHKFFLKKFFSELLWWEWVTRGAAVRLILLYRLKTLFWGGEKWLNLPFFFKFLFFLIFSPGKIYFTSKLTAGNSNTNPSRAKVLIPSGRDSALPSLAVPGGCAKLPTVEQSCPPSLPQVLPINGKSYKRIAKATSSHTGCGPDMYQQKKRTLKCKAGREQGES